LSDTEEQTEKAKAEANEKVAEDRNEKVKAVESLKMQGITEQNKKVQEMLRQMQEEAMQISELTLMQKDYISEISTYIKRVLIMLPYSIEVSMATLGNRGKKGKAFLNKNAHIIMTSDGNEATSTPLAELEPDLSMAVLSDAMPKIEEGLKIKRERMQDETTRLEQLAMQMESVYQTLQEDRTSTEDSENKLKKPMMKAPS